MGASIEIQVTKGQCKAKLVATASRPRTDSTSRPTLVTGSMWLT